MSIQGNNTGSGKSTQPPSPSYEAAANKPMAATATTAAPAAFRDTYQYEDGTLGGTPFRYDAAGNVQYNSAGNAVEGIHLGSTIPTSDRALAAMGYGSSIPANSGTGTGTGTGGSVGGGGGGGGSYGSTSSGGGGGGGGGPSFGTSSGGGGFGAGAVPGAVDDVSRQRVEQAILSRLEPQFRSDESQLRNQLLSSGLEVGSPAYASELDRLQRGQNDARQQAILTGGTEESRQVGLNAGLQGQAFSQGLQGATFDNQTRQQMLSELLLQRNTSLNELNSLRTGSQVAMPNFQGYYTNNAAAAPMFDAAQAQGNYNMTAAQNSQSGFNSMLGGLASLGGAAIQFSDARLKSNISRIGSTPSGVPLYSWDWKDGSGSGTGVLAHEVAHIPGAVLSDPSGYLKVDYSKIS